MRIIEDESGGIAGAVRCPPQSPAQFLTAEATRWTGTAPAFGPTPRYGESRQSRDAAGQTCDEWRETILRWHNAAARLFIDSRAACHSVRRRRMSASLHIPKGPAYPCHTRLIAPSFAKRAPPRGG